MFKFLSLCFVFIFWSSAVIAQTVNVPTVSSQYFNLKNDNSAIKIYIQYEASANKATILWEGKALDFSQTTWQQCRANQTQKLKHELANQVPVQVHAPKDMPAALLLDLYSWVQLSGNKYLHLVGREGSQMHYISLPVMPFRKQEAAYMAFAKGDGKAALAAANKLHPNTTTIKSEQTEEVLALAEARKKIKRASEYIPTELHYVFVQADGTLKYKGDVVNPMVLGSMIQGDLAAAYEGATTEAAARNYHWIQLQLFPKVSYQDYLTALVALQEGFYLYWDELAFTNYEKSYLELESLKAVHLQGTSPMLITQYDVAQVQYWQNKLAPWKGKTWAVVD